MNFETRARNLPQRSLATRTGVPGSASFSGAGRRDPRNASGARREKVGLGLPRLVEHPFQCHGCFDDKAPRTSRSARIMPADSPAMRSLVAARNRRARSRNVLRAGDFPLTFDLRRPARM